MEPNPLDVFGLRKILFIPEHFVTAIVPLSKIYVAEHWILTYTSGRYSIPDTRSSTGEKTHAIIGFENKQDLINFQLGFDNDSTNSSNN